MSLAELMATLHDRLARAGVPSPRVDAELLVASVLDVSRGALVAMAHRGDDAPAELVENLEPLIIRREGREPLQHLLGVAPFMDCELEVGPGVFVPRPETESVAEHAIHTAQSMGVGDAGVSIVDVCSGSGAVAIALARAVPWARVTAVEVSPEALPYLRRNVAALAPEVTIAPISVAAFGAVVTPHSLDMIVANPPYVPDSEVPNDPEVADFDPALALFGGVDGLDVVREIVELALLALRSGGVLVMEHSNLQGAAVAGLLRDKGFRVVATEKDLAGRERFTHAAMA